MNSTPRITRRLAFAVFPGFPQVAIHDLHATIMHRLGNDHTQLTWNRVGRDFRLTDVHGTVVKEIIAS